MSSEKTAWSGRFEEVPDESTQDFGASLPVDKRLWREDIDGSIAHATMLASQGLLSEEELSAIKEGLVQIAAGIEAGTITWHSTDEDIHMAIESELIERIGQAGKKLHTARSRNDQVATDLRLWTKQQISGDEGLLHALQDVREALRARASEHSHTIMPGYTHLQKAQPIRLADHLGAYIEMFTRDMFRMKAAFDAADVNVLGSGALAGTSHIINRDMTAELMRFRLVGDNTLDGVSDRDFVLDLLYACAVCQMHMSRLCEELILWSTSEFSFATFADTYSTGSSIMPQKKNPDFAELIRGKTGRVYGNLMALLVTLKGLPLAYNKDMQEDKEPLFDSVDTTRESLHILAGIIETITFDTATMKEAARGGFMAATDLADYLVGKKMAFRDAHEVVGKLVKNCEKLGKTLHDLSAEEFAKASDLFEPDVIEWIDIDKSVQRRDRSTL